MQETAKAMQNTKNVENIEIKLQEAWKALEEEKCKIR